MGIAIFLRWSNELILNMRSQPPFRFHLILIFTFLSIQISAQKRDSTISESSLVTFPQMVVECGDRILLIQNDLQGVNTSELRSNLVDFRDQLWDFHSDSSLSLLYSYPLWEIQGIQKRWGQLSEIGENVKTRIDKKYINLQEDLAYLNQYAENWDAFISEGDTSMVAPSVLTSGRSLLQKSNELTKVITDTIDGLNSLKQELVPLMTTLDLTDHRIALVLKDKKENLLAQDSPFLFNASVDKQFGSAQVTTTRDLHDTHLKNTKLFLQEKKEKLVLYILSFLLWIWIFRYFRKWRASAKGSFIRPYLRSAIILDHFLSLSLLAWFIEYFILFSGRPFFLDQIMIVLTLLPLGYFGKKVIPSRVLTFFWILTILFILSSHSSILIGSGNTLERWILFGVSLATTITYSILSFRERKEPEATKWENLVRYGKKILPFLLFLSFISLITNLAGRFTLAKLLLQTQFVMLMGGILLMIGDMALESLFSMFLRTPAGRASRILSHYPTRSRRYFNLLLRVLFLFYWVRAIVNNLGISDWVSTLWRTWMDFGYTFGEVTLKVGHLFDFLLIVIFFGILAKFLQVLISEEILSRLNLKRGVPLAVGILTRYFLLLLGFLMAIAAMGITMDRLSIIIGALGVGIGFGLQNIIGNFISGLILVFERPIHIGDVIVTDQVEGVVTEIGARASKVRSWDGAEMVVPNMVFISSTITNWTLSDSTRRRSLTFFADPEANPTEVIQMIQQVIRKHPLVKRYPDPLVLYKGYRDFYNEFQALYWVETEILRTDSEISSQVFEAMKEKGIHQNPNIPFMLKNRKDD